jgi:GT2 family glycosyltransferase
MDQAEVVVAIIVASVGRPEVLADVVADLDRQTHPVRHRVLSVPDESSLPEGGAPAGWLVVNDSGLTAQRNVGVRAVPDADVIFFFDDDAVVRDDYVERAVAVFARRPEVVGLTGRVLLDGAAGREIEREVAVSAIKASAEHPAGTAQPAEAPVLALYGCNFAYRASAARDVLFDDRLPFYSWLEDRDFARRLARFGRLVRADDCVIVHRGVKSGGRMAHTRFGYSQVMNPCYFIRTGSFSVGLAVHQMFRPVAKNIACSIVGAERGWRRERLRGNLLAAADVVRGRFTPERIREL